MRGFEIWAHFFSLTRDLRLGSSRDLGSLFGPNSGFVPRDLGSLFERDSAFVPRDLRSLFEPNSAVAYTFGA